MHLAMYKGPPASLKDKLIHWAIRAATFSRYSHCELVIDGWCYSSSARDGGVRKKQIDLDTGRWDLFEVEGSKEHALRWFHCHEGQGYDWLGAVGSVIPIFKSHPVKWYCSEACAAMLGKPMKLHPQALLEATE